jgi:hypothetical protein
LRPIEEELQRVHALRHAPFSALHLILDKIAQRVGTWHTRAHAYLCNDVCDVLGWEMMVAVAVVVVVVVVVVAVGCYINHG